MDFFEAQARAKKRTTRLVVLFALAVSGIIAAGYVATLVFLGQINGRMEPRGHGRVDYTVATPSDVWWQPYVFGCVALATILVVGLASIFKLIQLSSGGAAIAEMVGGKSIDPRTT